MPLKMVCDRTLKFVGECANLVFANVTESLFDLADSTTDTVIQASYFDTIKLLRAEKTEITNEWSGAVATAFDRLAFAAMVGNDDQDAGAAANSRSLSNTRVLLGDDLEEIVAFDQIVATASEHNHLALCLLQRRMGKVLRQEVSLQQLPLSPEFLTEQFVEVLRSRELRLKPKLLLLKLFDSLVLGQLPEVLSQCNQLLADLGILPDLNLEIVASRIDPSLQTRALSPSLHVKVEQQFSKGPLFPQQLKLLANNKVFRIQKTTQFDVPQPIAQEADVENKSRANSESSLPSGLPKQLLGTELSGAGDSDKDGLAIDGGRENAGVSSENLLGYLKDASATGKFFVSNPDFTFDGEGIGEFRRSDEAIRAEVESLLRAKGQCFSNLEDGDQKSIALLDQLFSQIYMRLGNPLLSNEDDQYQTSTPLGLLLMRIELPTTYWTLADPAFFERAQHPLRRFLNEVGRVADWLCGVDELSQDSLYKKLEEVVDCFVIMAINPSELCDLLSDFIRYVEAGRRQTAAMDQSVMDRALAKSGLNRKGDCAEDAELAAGECSDKINKKSLSPVDENALRQIAFMKQGAWVSLAADRGGVSKCWRVIGFVEALGVYILGDHSSLKTIMVSLDRLTSLKEKGELMVVDNSCLFDDALSVAVHSLAQAE